jgi:hypothetical protein
MHIVRTLFVRRTFTDHGTAADQGWFVSRFCA